MQTFPFVIFSIAPKADACSVAQRLSRLSGHEKTIIYAGFKSTSGSLNKATTPSFYILSPDITVK